MSLVARTSDAQDSEWPVVAIVMQALVTQESACFAFGAVAGFALATTWRPLLKWCWCWRPFFLTLSQEEPPDSEFVQPLHSTDSDDEYDLRGDVQGESPGACSNGAGDRVVQRVPPGDDYDLRGVVLQGVTSDHSPTILIAKSKLMLAFSSESAPAQCFHLRSHAPGNKKKALCGHAGEYSEFRTCTPCAARAKKSR